MRNRPAGTPKGRPSFEEACRTYQNRYTAEHVPPWAASCPADHGGTERRFYAPQFASDREWYENTLFPGEPEHQVFGFRDSCYTRNETWPFGQWLDEPFRRGDPPPRPHPGPRICVSTVVNGSSDGAEVVGLEAAARHAAEWIRGINPEDVGVDFRVELEILDEDD